MAGETVARYYSPKYGDFDPERAMTLTVAEWLAMLDAYGGRCAYCGVTANHVWRDMDRLVMDHMIPMHRGGDHAITNVAPCCLTCNSKKGDMTPLEWIMVQAGLAKRVEPRRRRAEGVFIEAVRP